MATRFDFHELPARSGTPPLSSDKALRAASRYLLEQSPRVVVEALDAAIENSQRRTCLNSGPCFQIEKLFVSYAAGTKRPVLGRLDA